MTTVTLTPAEMLQAGIAGLQRQVENVAAGKHPTYGLTGHNDWQLHIEGAMAEMALAKYQGRYWAGKGSYGAPDVGNMDVRSSALDNASLIIHPQDEDNRIFWLLTGSLGTYQVRGWITGRDAKRPEYWRTDTGRPAYFVPQDKLQKG